MGSSETANMNRHAVCFLTISELGAGEYVRERRQYDHYFGDETESRIFKYDVRAS